jgi:benzoyl-CoA reductase/2-hydroxyglutaryl-CoA dehydratase subunit BcrC/BadD/HgdB
MTYYNELLTLCSFDEAEIVSQKQRIEKTFKILGLGPVDMDRAVARVQKYFDMELVGVRKALGLWLKELFDVVLAREEGKNIIYFGYPPFQYTGLAIKAAAKSKNDFYIGCPEVVLCQTLGQIFDKLVPVLEAGEAAGLPPGHAMCSLLQIKLGALEKGIIPIPDMSIATSYFCDMGPKADELMQYKYGYPVEYVDGCLDSPWGAWPVHDRETVQYLGTQVNNMFGTLKDMFGLEINEDTWQQARLVAGKLYVAINELTRHLTADPVPLSVADSELVSNIPTACTGVAMEEGPETVGILAREVGKRVEKGVGVVTKGAPRVAIMFQSFSDTVINRLIEEVGLAVPATMVLFPAQRQALERYPYPTLGEKRAEQAMFGGAYHSTYGWIHRNMDALKFAKIDGVIYTYPFSCRPIVCTSKLTKLEIEKETGLPTLLLEMDLYDSRNYSAASLRTRLEGFAEMLKAKKAAA